MYLVQLWREAYAAGRIALLGRYFNGWRRVLRTRKLQKLHEIELLRMDERLLRITMYRLRNRYLALGLHRWLAYKNAMNLRYMVFGKVMRKRLLKNSLFKWHRIVWHDIMEEELIARAWFIHTWRAVKFFSRLLERIRKNQLTHALARWLVNHARSTGRF